MCDPGPSQSGRPVRHGCDPAVLCDATTHPPPLFGRTVALRSGPSARELGAPGRQSPIPFLMKKTFGNPALGEGGSGCDLDAVRRHLIEPVGQAILFLLQVVLALEAHPELCRVAKEAREQ